MQGDDEALVEELGDLLFQVMFLSLLLEERGVADLGTVAERLREKLIRRHPHVFGDRVAETPDDAKKIWREMKQQERA
jgi:uncharacterized protein YabN with tetrapyrrole methylase and pyrophosphatase domain